MNVAIMGFGTIGSGVAEVLSRNAALIEKRAGEKLVLTRVLDLRDFEGEPIAPLIVHDYKEIAEDDSIDLVVETMGGVEPAYTFVKAMLLAGKSVATSNKALVADKGAELLAIAREKRVQFQFEASVGGGIPIIRTILGCLTGDEIEEITGIINGTTNYMMTRMAQAGLDFDAALAEAQAKGYAEADPSADIEGHDATRKIAILSSLVAEAQVDYQDISVEGISKITHQDFLYAKKLGRAVKLLAMSKRHGDTFTARVAPFLLSEEHPLYAVCDVMNAVYVVGNMLGPSMYYGSGAGSLPTASAVVGDLVDMARNVTHPAEIRWSSQKLRLADPKKEEFENFLRLAMTEEEAKKLPFAVTEIVDAGVPGEVGCITEGLSEYEFEEAAEGLADRLISRIRLA
ncbi:MAG: homoserine dehydrogenase [Lachnospiraceae bacterium]|nr:homoserine dehydrogenase [Lachnospiraceae bacterium]